MFDLQDECPVKRWKIQTNVSETVKLAQELLRSDTGVDAVLSSDVPITTDGNATTLAAELDKAKVRISKLESKEIITARWHEELLEKFNQRHAEEVGAWKETSA